MPEILEILLKMRMEMKLGHSISACLENLCRSGANETPLLRSFRTWFIRTQSGQTQESILKGLPLLVKKPSTYALVRILERGLTGSPIDEALSELESEFFSLAKQNYERRLQLLPLKLLVPLTLFILPGTMGLLLCPIFFRLLYSF